MDSCRATDEKPEMNDRTTLHGEWCGAETFPLTCRYCGRSVFFFRCRCGSKVFFEELGPSWPKHHCDEHLEAKGLSPLTGSSPTSHLSREVIGAQAIMRPEEHDYPVEIEPAYAAKIRRNLEAERRGKRELLRMDPPPGKAHQDTGRIQDLAPEVDVFKQARYPKDSPIAFAMLGSLAKEPMARVVLVVDDPDQDDLESYSCYIPQRLMKKTGIICGDVVHFKIEPVEVPNWARVWLCVELEPMFMW